MLQQEGGGRRRKNGGMISRRQPDGNKEEPCGPDQAVHSRTKTNVKYQIVQQIGRGSCSRVLLAECLASEDSSSSGSETATSSSVATHHGQNRGNKTVPERLNSFVVLKERDASTNAIQEARLLRSLRCHPCIVRFEDAFKVHGVNKICIAMEVAERDLGAVLKEMVERKQNVEERVALEWLCQIGLGLAFLHSRGVVHRDVKPQNILILACGRVVLGDLGTAKANMFEEHIGSTTLAGTPFYLAPEVLSGTPYGSKADVWSFGCLAFDIASSGLHHAFAASALAELDNRIRAGDVQWHKVENHREIADDLIRPCLRKDSSHRPGIDEVLGRPLMIRAIGSFVADLREGRFRLSQARAKCLLKQLTSLGLSETALFGLRLGKIRKRSSSTESIHSTHERDARAL